LATATTGLHHHEVPRPGEVPAETSWPHGGRCTFAAADARFAASRRQSPASHGNILPAPIPGAREARSWHGTSARGSQAPRCSSSRRSSPSAAVKDTAKNGPIAWAYYSFDGGDNLKATALPFPATASCQTCHAANTAVEQTFVQFYPTLFEVAKAKGTVKPTWDPRLEPVAH
jgi:hypothetical protein